MHKTILYIEKIEKSSIIHYINNQTEKVDVSINKILNNICLRHLTTLEGRLEAIKSNFNIIKNVPIYIDEKLVLFVVLNKLNNNLLYINSIYIKSIEQLIDNIKVVFYDGQYILIESNLQTVFKNYEKCLKIKKKINLFY